MLIAALAGGDLPLGVLGGELRSATELGVLLLAASVLCAAAAA